MHFVSLANRPGYHVADRERATNLAEVLALLAARRASDVPAGQFITSMGGWHAAHVRRAAAADARRARRGGSRPARVPVPGLQRPGAHEYARQAVLRDGDSPLAGPCTVGADGSIATGGRQANRALYHLRVRQTCDDKMRSAPTRWPTRRAWASPRCSTRRCPAPAARPAPLDPQPTQALSNLDHYRMYDAWLALHARGQTIIRLQMNFLHNQATSRPGIAEQLPELHERLKNQFQFFGDDMMTTGGDRRVGRAVRAAATPRLAVWLEAQRLVAQARWRNENAAGSPRPQASSSASRLRGDGRASSASRTSAGASTTSRLATHRPARPAEGARRRGRRCRLPLDPATRGRRPRRAAVPADRRPRYPGGCTRTASTSRRSTRGSHMHYATTGLNVARAADQPGPADHAPGGAARLHARGRLVPEREDELGSIEEGKLADLVVLEQGLLHRHRRGHAQDRLGSHRRRRRDRARHRRADGPRARQRAGVVHDLAVDDGQHRPDRPHLGVADREVVLVEHHQVARACLSRSSRARSPGSGTRRFRACRRAAPAAARSAGRG